MQPEPGETHERQPVRDQELCAVITGIVLRLDNQDPEHQHDVTGRAPFEPSEYARAFTISARKISKSDAPAQASN